MPGSRSLDNATRWGASGQTALHLASIAGRVEILDEFSRAHVDIEMLNRQRESPLDVVKHRYARWLQHKFGAGVMINPHVAALALVAQVVNSHLRKLPGNPLGIFISDENHQVARDVDKSIRLLRGAEGSVRLTQIIEKGFFVESHKSLVLQLCDLCAYTIRRHEEIGAGGKAKPVDAELWKMVGPLVTVGDEKFADVIGWLESQQKKERPGA